MKIGFALSRIALFFIGTCIAVYAYADESPAPSSVSSDSKQIICKTPEEVKRFCFESLQIRRFTSLEIPGKSQFLDYSDSVISNLQNRLSLVRKHIGNPTFRLNIQDARPIIGMGLINQEILRISFLLGTDLDIERASTEELMQSLTELELKPNIGLGFEGYW